MKIQLIKKTNVRGIDYVININGNYVASDTDRKEAEKKYNRFKDNAKLKPSEEILKEEII
jgi:hypothetical protein